MFDTMPKWFGQRDRQTDRHCARFNRFNRNTCIFSRASYFPYCAISVQTARNSIHCTSRSSHSAL